MFVASRFGLTGRSIALCGLLLLGTVGVLASALISQNYHHSLDRLTHAATTYARLIADNAEPAVLLNDREAMERVLTAAGQDHSVDSVTISDTAQNELAAYHRRVGSAPGHHDIDGVAIPARPPREFVASLLSNHQLRVVVPIWRNSDSIDLGLIEESESHPIATDGYLGLVRMDLNLAAIEGELAQQKSSSAFIALAVLAFGIAATVFAVRPLLNPLRNLVETTAAIAGGDRAKRARTNAVGEIGALARSFNHMADRLQESHASIERKVAERTAELAERKTELENEVAERLKAEDALRASDARLRRQNEALVALSKRTSAERADLETGIQEITSTAARALDVNRVSVWLYEPDRSQVRCLDLFEADCTTHSDGYVLSASDCPAYFNALDTNRTIAATDVRTDVRTRDFCQTQASTAEVNSTLDAPIRRDGQTVGVVCHQRTGPAREWTLEERSFAGSIADLVALAIEADQRRRTESELRRAKDAAEAANRAKSDFLANMSHEIRTPMSAIIGYSENLQDPTLQESDRQQAICSIRRNGEHLLGIINDILDISKIEAGKLEPEIVRCSLVQIIAEVESMLRARAQAKGIEFSVSYHSKLPDWIETDPTRIRQILVNLVGNAIKFTESGGIELHVRYHLDNATAPSTAGTLQLNVLDTGIGMSTAQLERVFEPFCQADEGMARRFGGTGLGLAITRQLVEILGGEIHAESEPGIGSKFAVRLQIAAVEGACMIDPEQLPSDATCPDNATVGAEVERRGSINYRILLVEDGPDNQKLISFLLRKAGATVSIAENGKEALDAALAARDAGTPFDVILMDMQMPIMDGYTATTLLRHEGYSGAIVALTAHAMAHDRRRCLEAGCNDYASKPVDRHRLIELIQTNVERLRSISETT